MTSRSRKHLAASLLKLGLIIGGILGGFYVLFDTPFSTRYEIRAGDLDPLPALKQSRQPGPRIIFRLDDVERGVREKQVLAIVSVFEEKDAPIELGFIPYVNGEASFALPRIKAYVTKGVADVSVHGVTHSQHEFHTGRSGTTREALAKGLLKAKNALREYYGVQPVAFLVPYDVFDEAGYKAVRDAGLRILSSQWQTDDHRGTEPADARGRRDDDGLYRLPSVDDAVAWNAERQSWGEFQPLSNLLFSVRASLDRLGVAVVSLHPAAFEDGEGDVDLDKLDKLEVLIEETGKLGMITTFRNWYCTYAPHRQVTDALLCPPTRD